MPKLDPDSRITCFCSGTGPVQILTVKIGLPKEGSDVLCVTSEGQFTWIAFLIPIGKRYRLMTNNVLTELAALLFPLSLYAGVTAMSLIIFFVVLLTNLNISQFLCFFLRHYNRQ